MNIQGVTLDFFQTLVRHRGGKGRGASLVQYLANQGLSSNAWEHQVLYDVFDFYGSRYRAGFSAQELSLFWTAFTVRLFERLQVSGAGPASPQEHSEAVKSLLGPSSLELYEDALTTLEWLQSKQLRIGIVSNWQRGLTHFCRELV